MGRKEQKPMARNRRRPYGTGSVVKEGKGYAIRWREDVIGEDGQVRREMKYKALGNVTKTEAEAELNTKINQAQKGPVRTSKSVTFEAHAERWKRDMLPMYKHSVQLGHRNILDVHLLPKFGSRPVTEISTMEIQGWITDLRNVEFRDKYGKLVKRGYAPHSIDHFHEVLNAVMRAAVQWYGLPANPARGVHVGKVRPQRRKWALKPNQARELLQKLPLKARAMVALDIATGIRRGEVLAARWEDLNEAACELRIDEASYRGVIDDPKTDAGKRSVMVPREVMAVLLEWKKKSNRTKPADFLFATRNGKLENSNNILRRYVFPACDTLNLPRATWLTFRRTFSTWSHQNQVNPKDLAEMMGHADVDTQFEYVVGDDEVKRAAAAKIGKELSSFVQISEPASNLIN